jgi:hypothetical protein
MESSDKDLTNEGKLEDLEESKDSGQDGQKLSKGQKKKLKEKQRKEKEAELRAQGFLPEADESKKGAAQVKGSKQPPSVPKDRVPLRVLGEWSADAHPHQKYDKDGAPLIPVSQQFPNSDFNEGEILEYEQDWNRFRTNDAEKRAMERLMYQTDYTELRRAAEVHR